MEVRRDIAEILLTVARLERSCEKYQDSLASADLAIAHLTILLTADRGLGGSALRLGEAMNLAGGVALNLEDLDSAVDRYRGGKGVIEPLIEGEGADVDAMALYAKLTGTLGIILAKTGQVEEGQEEARLSYVIRGVAYDAKPNDAASCFQLGVGHYQWAQSLSWNDKDGFLTQTQRAIEIFSQLNQSHPDVPGYKIALDEALLMRERNQIEDICSSTVH